MAARAPKQWSLTTHETVNSVENWRQNLLYTLSLDQSFAPYLGAGVTWGKKTAANPNRGFIDDADPVPEAARKTAVQKSATLDLMLGQIANYCVVISRNSIIKQAISLDKIWQLIREHYGFQKSGAHFLDLGNIKLEPDERHEDLYQRLCAFFEDNLLHANGGLTHHGENAPDEDLTPSLENTIVYIWLNLIHPGLPALVKQRYGPELRNKTVASLKPEISQAMSSLLSELRSIEEARVMFTKSKTVFSNGHKKMSRAPTKSCILCKTAGRPGANSHYLSECRHLPQSDKQYIRSGKSRLTIEDDTCSNPLSSDEEDDNLLLDSQPSARRVAVAQSPVLHCYYNEFEVPILLDSGATTNFITKEFADSIGLPITKSSQNAFQADGVTPLAVLGEVHCKLTRGDMIFNLDALVVLKLDTHILGGNPFLITNDIGMRPRKHQIVLKGREIINYAQLSVNKVSVRRAQASLVRGPLTSTVVLPGEYIDLYTSTDTEPDAVLALEPRWDSPCNKSNQDSPWPHPNAIQSVGHTLRLVNTTPEPINLKKDEHVCQVRPIVKVSTSPEPVPSSNNTPAHFAINNHQQNHCAISVDPDKILPAAVKQQFEDLNKEFASTFSPSIPKYNGASGKIEAVVNMGPTLPPQRKGRLPSYNRDTLITLQTECDELEAQGILAKPEDVNINVEYLNLTFLVKKPSGGHRLVTSFGEVGQYSKPQPALMTSVDQVLRNLGGWKYIIVTDLRKAFYQIPLAYPSMKYCGIVTPFKGVRVYTRCAMGMPGSETALEELMNRVLGDYVMEGWCAKIADDLYVGADTTDELLHNWGKCLESLRRNNLGLSAPKTVIAPKSTIVLGWKWSQGSLSATSHKITSLTTTAPPESVRGLRSFIGAYKVLSRVLRGYAMLLDPLEKATAGGQSRDKISWDEHLLDAFKKAQNALADCKSITTPVADDQLWIVTDASVKKGGIAATLYVNRNDKLSLAGFFNAKLRNFQVKWLPCEALCIASAINHFAPFIIQSKHQAYVLTDSKPCVEAYKKLQHGQFSASARLSTFLSTLSRYSLEVHHIAGVTNLPSDYTSRNPPVCQNQSCQVCKFVFDLSDSAVRNVTVQDVISGSHSMPFTSRVAWQATQQECSDLRRVHAHLTQGTRPGKKATNVRDIKRYLLKVVIANDGLLVVHDDNPFQPRRERIVVPRAILPGLLTATHIRFHHPSPHQMKQLISRHFYALEIDKAIQNTCESCHHCMALKSVPQTLKPQSTSAPPDSIGTTFALDVMRRYKQFILVIRESVTSYTRTSLIESEKHDTLRDAIISLCAELKPYGDHSIQIRVDPAPGLVCLVNDNIFRAHGINLIVGQHKNVNKNPVAERAIEELGVEILKVAPEGGPIKPVTLALATANMNSRIRRDGLSSREMWTQRDQITGEQLPLEDRQIILKQHFDRTNNHGPSSKAKKTHRYI